MREQGGVYRWTVISLAVMFAFFCQYMQFDRLWLLKDENLALRQENAMLRSAVNLKLEKGIPQEELEKLERFTEELKVQKGESKNQPKDFTPDA